MESLMPNLRSDSGEFQIRALNPQLQSVICLSAGFIEFITRSSDKPALSVPLMQEDL